MKAVTQEWADKAEEDWEALGILFRARRTSHHNNVCFHAQQCVEKYLKARLVEAGTVFQKTHDLLKLLALVLPAEPSWNTLQPALSALDPYSVLHRYPGFSATRLEATQARKNCATVRAATRVSLGQPL